MRVSVVQADIIWENVVANRLAFTENIAAQSGVDVVVLPEMFTTGFSMEPEHLAEQPNGETSAWLTDCAMRYNVAITGSFIVNDNGTFRNLMFFVKPSGEHFYYDKRHLFRMANEHEHYQQGESRVVVTYKGWKILLLVCYDLRFPVWSRNIANGYDMIAICASWPQSRIYAWRTLLAARAIENQCYVVACNRVGSDSNGNQYSGDSMILNPRGEVVVGARASLAETITADLRLDELNAFRQKFPVAMDSDTFRLV